MFASTSDENYEIDISYFVRFHEPEVEMSLSVFFLEVIAVYRFGVL